MPVEKDSAKKAAAGAVLAGGIGLLAGTIGSNKIELTCLSCGNKWRPGMEQAQTAGFQATPASRRFNKIVLIVFVALMAFIILICCI